MVKKKWIPYFFLFPFLLLFAIFYIGPLVYAFYLSLFHQYGLRPPIFVGFKNYWRAITDSGFIFSILNMIKFFLIQGTIMLGLALMLALYLDGKTSFFKSFLKIVYYIPFAIPTVISGIMWGFMYSKALSPLKLILFPLGIHVDFLSSSALFGSIVNIVTWEWTGYNMIIIYSGLQSIPHDLYEAARIDGASSFQIVRYIKLPLVRPTLILTVIFTIIGTFQLFNEPYVLSALTYVPINFTPNMYIYTTAFSYGNFNYAAAMALILAAFTFVFSMSFIRYSGLEGGKNEY